MLFFPKGVMNGEVVDPSKLSQDFVEPNRVVSNTSHYQWANDTFDQRVNLESGTHINVINKTVAARLQISNSADPIVGRGGGTPNANLHQIKLDRGLQEVGDGDIRAEWVAEDPELVMICYSMQYYMPGQTVVNDLFSPASGVLTGTFRVRFQSAIQIDGNNILGTGPLGIENSIAGIRGTGFAHTSLGVSGTTIQYLEAGAHFATVVANLGRPDKTITGVDATTNNLAALYDYFRDKDGKSFKGFVIGNRNLIVMRFARGGLLGG